MHASWGKAPTSLLAVWFAREGYALRQSAFLTPSPMTAEEESTSDPSPFSLSRRERVLLASHETFQIHMRNVQTPNDTFGVASERPISSDALSRVAGATAWEMNVESSSLSVRPEVRHDAVVPTVFGTCKGRWLAPPPS